jgi:hypothetical protein
LFEDKVKVIDGEDYKKIAIPYNPMHPEIKSFKFPD